MACATLKRSLDWDPLNSPSNSSSGNNTNGRPAKKRCLNVFTPLPPKEASPFGEVKPKLTAEYIAATIKEEMKRFNHRKQLHYSCSASPSTSNTNTNTETTSSDCSSINENSPSIANTLGVGLQSPSRRDQPLFTFRQVNLICDRLLKERETHLRQEYDNVLNTKLAEQYDTFVKFTYDQIQKRFEKEAIPSYLS